MRDVSARESAEAAVLRAVGRSIPLDGEVCRLTRAQAGAVGDVIGVRGLDGARYALKIYPAHLGSRADVESAALQRLRKIGIPVPEVILRGAVDESPVVFLLMGWLSGRRWAEHLPDIGPAQTLALLEQAGALLRRIHSVPGPWFGDLLSEPPVHPTAVDVAAERLARLVRTYRQVGGSDAVVQQTSRFVEERYPALLHCLLPVLCHQDFVNGNLMVHLTGRARISGVFDLERASWADPMEDLALSYIHFRNDHPDLVHFLIDAYGVTDERERLRLQAYEALHLMDERCWISADRPQGWQHSIAVLDGRLRTLLRDRTPRTHRYGR